MRYLKTTQAVLWFGRQCSDEKLSRMTRDEPGVFFNYNVNPLNSNAISGGCLNQIYEDSRSNLWLAIWRGGVDLLDRSTGVFTHHLPETHGLIDNGVLRVYVASLRAWCALGRAQKMG